MTDNQRNILIKSAALAIGYCVLAWFGKPIEFSLLVPIGPFLLLLPLIDKKMDTWNRYGLAAALAFACGLAAVFLGRMTTWGVAVMPQNYYPPYFQSAWNTLPLVACVYFLARRQKLTMMPITKFMVILVTASVVSAWLEGHIRWDAPYVLTFYRNGWPTIGSGFFADYNHVDSEYFYLFRNPTGSDILQIFILPFAEMIFWTAALFCTSSVGAADRKGSERHAEKLAA